jgi:hypothetical protein
MTSRTRSVKVAPDTLEQTVATAALSTAATVATEEQTLVRKETDNAEYGVTTSETTATDAPAETKVTESTEPPLLDASALTSGTMGLPDDDAKFSENAPIQEYTAELAREHDPRFRYLAAVGELEAKIRGNRAMIGADLSDEMLQLIADLRKVAEE